MKIKAKIIIAILALKIFNNVAAQMEISASTGNAISNSTTALSKIDGGSTHTNNQTRLDSTKIHQGNQNYSLMGTGTQEDVIGSYADRTLISGFQDFVYSTTGKNYNFFGYELFGSSKYGQPLNLPVPAGYEIGPGDELDIKLWGNVDLAIRLTVDRNGQITIPKIGTVVIAGTTAENLEKELKERISKIYKGFEINATLGKLKSIKIYLVGDAKKPGSHIIPGYSNFIGAIFDTGGPNVLGTMRDIRLIRDGRIISHADLYQFIANGKVTGDNFLKNGDVIQISKAGPRVAITGAFDKSAIYELKNQGENLGNVLIYGGGLSSISTPHKVLLERVDSASKNAPRSVIELDFSKDANRLELQDGDILTIFPVANEFKNAVTLRGNVASPLRYAHKKGMRVSDLIPEPKALVMGDYYQNKNMLVQHESGKRIKQEQVIAEVKNLLDEINWDYAVVQRVDYTSLKTNLIKFNLRKAVIEKSDSDNIELVSGDVVTIFGVKDMPVPTSKISHFVKISGEVNVPGVYQIDPGTNLNDLLKIAGGLTREAYLYGAIFSRESIRGQQQDNLNKAIKQMEGDISLQTNNILQNLTEGSAATAQAQIMGQKLFLQRLQTLKATGRVSLGLKPDDLVPPNVTLENGDAISIPNKPSFVSAFGAVLAETSFIHQSGLTVDNLLAKAGVTRSADIDAIFLIRADGSIESNEAARSTWSFGSGFLSKSLHPGDTVFVPEMLDRRQAYSKFMQGAKDWTQILYQFGLGAAAFKVLRN